MSPIDALRTRRSFDDLPPVSSDDELVEWARGLTASAAPGRPRRIEPLRARPVEQAIDVSDAAVEAAPRVRPLRADRPRRREPLRAERTVAESPHLTTEEVFAEIARRSGAAPRPTLRLRLVTPS